MVIDTSVFIEHLRAKEKSETTLASLPSGVSSYVSILTTYELLCGADSILKKQEVFDLLSNTQILTIDSDVVTKAAELFLFLRRRNQLIGAIDILIAATALVHNLPVKTLNIRHFERIDGLILF